MVARCVIDIEQGQDQRMLVASKINDLLEAHAPAAFCDACLAKALGLPDAEQVELRTERLATMPYFVRTQGLCSACGNEAMVISVPAGPKGRKWPADMIGGAGEVR
jgi:hypothetical protein